MGLGLKGVGDATPLIMGVVNTTPDSFSDGGLYESVDAAIAWGLELADQGADILDVGGESTRPGAVPVSTQEELRRVVPVIEGLMAVRPHLVCSVDTSKTAVAAAAIGAGATMVNDVSAASDPGMAEICAGSGAYLVLMHMRGTPSSMQQDTNYGNLVDDVCRFLNERIQAVIACGMDPAHLIVDPGLGFGKALMDNLDLIKAIPVFQALGYPVLIGASRKRFIGQIVGKDEVSARVHGSIGAALAAAFWGASLLRVHDVRATKDALDVFMKATQ
jgi:dihydropteroate synthase